MSTFLLTPPPKKKNNNKKQTNKNKKNKQQQQQNNRYVRSSPLCHIRHEYIHIKNWLSRFHCAPCSNNGYMCCSDLTWITGPWFNIKMSSYQYRKSHCGDKTVVRSSYLHNGISYTGKMTSLYWISPQGTCTMRLLLLQIKARVWTVPFLIHFILKPESMSQTNEVLWC